MGSDVSATLSAGRDACRYSGPQQEPCSLYLRDQVILNERLWGYTRNRYQLPTWAGLDLISLALPLRYSDPTMPDAPSPSPTKSETPAPPAVTITAPPASPVKIKPPESARPNTTEQDTSSNESDSAAVIQPRTSPFVTIFGVFTGVLLISTLVLGVMVGTRNQTIFQNRNRAEQNTTNQILLQAQFDEAKVEIARLKTQALTEKGAAAQLQTKWDLDKTELAEVKSQLGKTQSLANTFQSQMEEAKVTSIRHQGEVEIAKAQTAVMQTQLNDAQTDTARLQTQLDKARTNLTALEARLEKADKEIAQLQLLRPKK